MAMLPARRRGQNLTVVDPLGEFEDIRDRMGQLMNMAFGDSGLARLADVPWSPMADVSETDDAYVVQAELPGVSKDQVDVQLQDRELTSAARSSRTARASSVKAPGAPAASSTGPTCPATSRPTRSAPSSPTGCSR